MNSGKTPKNLKEILYSPQKKFLKIKENNIKPAETNASISQASSEHLKLIIQTYRIRNKELKMKLQEEYQTYLWQSVLN